MIYGIHLERIYAPAQESDGARILVDRLWPRGKKREHLSLTEWYPDASPSPDLRRQLHKGDLDYATFSQRYRDELDANPDSLIPLMRHARQHRLTLLTASRDLQHSHLPTLQQALLDALNEEDDEADGPEPSSPPCYHGSID
jgi:uncharacterized protein YeaO (DUF488 family)